MKSIEQRLEYPEDQSAIRSLAAGLTFQMDNAGLSHQQLMSSIGLIGKKVTPIVNPNV